MQLVFEQFGAAFGQWNTHEQLLKMLSDRNHSNRARRAEIRPIKKSPQHGYIREAQTQPTAAWFSEGSRASPRSI
jgi:hypothetical protein